MTTFQEMVDAGRFHDDAMLILRSAYDKADCPAAREILSDAQNRVWRAGGNLRVFWSGSTVGQIRQGD